MKEVNKDKQMDLMQQTRNQSQAEKTLKSGKNDTPNIIKDEDRAWEDDRL
ncbi:hypothetical protein HPT25_10940 [Bacillus sp. BRMEA1]|nr:hypothetical protein [Neobacillus endophyticus]NRD77898.1 hypothetical protein [Neobacillus endophyticus]